jgi:putative NADH-flavin reductase
MHLFVLGATGRTGVELVDLALARDHQVTAFVRSPDKIVRRDPRLAVVRGDVFDSSELAGAMKGHDAVVSALGPSPKQAILGGGRALMRDSAVSALRAMTAAHVKRFLVVSSALLFRGGGLGVGFFRSLIGPHIADSRAMEAEIEASALEWTIARPPRLVMTRDEGYRAADGDLPERLAVSIAMSWRAVAAFLLDATERNLHVRKVVGLVGASR